MELRRPEQGTSCRSTFQPCGRAEGGQGQALKFVSYLVGLERLRVESAIAAENRDMSM